MAKINLGRVKPEINNNLTTTTTGAALDAVQGRVLNEKINGINDNLVPQEAAKIADPDDFTEQGIYFLGADLNHTNLPSGVNGWLVVMPINAENGNTFIKQLWFRAGTPNSNDHITLIRTYNKMADTQWSRWHKVSSKQQTGYIYTTVSGANITQSYQIQFEDAYSSNPVVHVSTNTTAPQSVFASVSGISGSGFTLNIRRTDSTTNTGVYWTSTARE